MHSVHPNHRLLLSDAKENLFHPLTFAPPPTLSTSIKHSFLQPDPVAAHFSSSIYTSAAMSQSEKPTDIPHKFHIYYEQQQQEQQEQQHHLHQRQGQMSVPSTVDKAYRAPLSVIHENQIHSLPRKPLVEEPKVYNVQLSHTLGYEKEMETPYINDIVSHLYYSERKYGTIYGYMDYQREISADMRGILLDWLIEVCEEYHCAHETLFLAVNYIDRYLRVTGVSRQFFQLVGITAILIASKLEEINPPTLEQLAYICDNIYDHETIMKMELKMLLALNFDLVAVTPRHFAGHFLKVTKADAAVASLTHFLCEVALIDYEMLRFKSSEIAAASIVLAHHMLEHTYWGEDMSFFTGYDHIDIIQCMQTLLSNYVKTLAMTATSLYEKYKDPSHQSVVLLKTRSDMPSFQAPYKS